MDGSPIASYKEKLITKDMMSLYCLSYFISMTPSQVVMSPQGNSSTDHRKCLWQVCVLLTSPIAMTKHSTETRYGREDFSLFTV